MKHILSLLLLGCMMTLSITGCSRKHERQYTSFCGRIVTVNENSILVTNALTKDSAGELFEASIKDITLLDENQKKTTASKLTKDMIVTIYYDGSIQEINPPILNNVAKIQLKD